MTASPLERRAWNIAHAGLDLDPAFQAFDELLRAHVSYAIASWSTHDPATGLFTSCTMSGVPKDPVGEARPRVWGDVPPSPYGGFLERA